MKYPKKKVMISFDSKQHEEIRAIAYYANKTISKIIREVLQEYLDKQMQIKKDFGDKF